MTLRRRHLVLGPAALLAAPQLHAQAAWPRQSVRFVVPFAPGGTSEIVARTVANELTKQLGQTVFVDNKGGGAGLPAMQEVAKAAPDGHTIILGHVGSLAVNPYIFPNQPYDVNRDFVPVTLLAKVPNLFVIHPEVPARDFKEFIRVAGMTHVRTSPYYPQSNGKIERWNKTVKSDALRVTPPASVEEARRVVARFVAHYNGERLHSAIGYVTPDDVLAGRAEAIWAARDRKLEEAREVRAKRRREAREEGKAA